MGCKILILCHILFHCQHFCHLHDLVMLKVIKQNKFVLQEWIIFHCQNARGKKLIWIWIIYFSQNFENQTIYHDKCKYTGNKMIESTSSKMHLQLNFLNLFYMHINRIENVYNNDLTRSIQRTQTPPRL